MIVTASRIIILLKKEKRETKTGYQKIKFAYDIQKGEFLVRKQISSRFQEIFLNFMSKSLEKENKEGFVDIAFVNLHVYFERLYPYNLEGWFKAKRKCEDIYALIQLQNAVKILHTVNYKSASIKKEMFPFCISTFSYEHKGSSFHGDISPQSIVCEESGKTQSYKLGNIEACNEFSKVVWTPGWGSPETIEYAVTKSKYQELTPEQFNTKFGQKKDTWALALLCGTILRENFHAAFPEKCFPCFSFITDKINVIGEEIDESGLASLTQEEVDAKLDEIIHLATYEKPWLKGAWLTIK